MFFFMCTFFFKLPVTSVDGILFFSDGSIDEKTRSFLKLNASVPKGQCEAMVEALEGSC